MPSIQPMECVFQQTGPEDWGSHPGASAPRSPRLALVGFVGLCLLVGATAGVVTAPAVAGWYPSLRHPPGTPPDWVFGPVWTTLYVAMGTAAWLVWRQVGPTRPLRLWGWQLAANAAWSPAFFGLHNPPLGMAILLVLIVLVAMTSWRFWRIRSVAGYLMAPYLAWCCYAAYLNAGIWWLNGASP